MLKSVAGSFVLCQALACQTNPGMGLSSSSSGSSSGASSSGTSMSSDTSGAPCGQDELLILDHCYRRVDIPTVESATFAVAADFDGDGATDLVTNCAGEMSHRALCLVGFSTDSRPDVEQKLAQLDIPWAGGAELTLHATDFDGDQQLDVFASTLYHFAFFSLVDGAFVLRSELAYDVLIHELPDSPIDPAFPLDVDLDGRPEVIAGSGWNGLRVWRLDPITSTWQPSGDRQLLPGCGDLADARVADLDHDGRSELIAIGSHNTCEDAPAPGSFWNRVFVFTPKPGTAELMLASDFPAELPAQALALGDFNGDDNHDLVVSDITSFMIFLGKGDGSFQPPVPAIDIGFGDLATDFNADGLDELIVYKEGVNHLLVAPPRLTLIDLPPAILGSELAADLNQDGYTDLVASDYIGLNLYLVLFLSK